MAGVLAFTEKREQVVDFPSYPTAVTALELMIPKPTIKKRNYIGAVLLPFQTQVQSYLYNPCIRESLAYNYYGDLHTQVWIGLLISIVVGTASLYGIALCMSNVRNKWASDNYKKGIKNITSKNISEKNRLERAFTFILGLIVVQGF